MESSVKPAARPLSITREIASPPSARSMVKGRATAEDLIVSQKMREFRLAAGLSQQQLADKLGVSYQQVHKFERGLNRLSVGQLTRIARTLQLPIHAFFEPVGQEAPAGMKQQVALIRAFSSLSAEQRSVALLAIRAMAGEDVRR